MNSQEIKEIVKAEYGQAALQVKRGGRSCWSVLAEATFNALAGSEWRALSAGSHPTSTVHPRFLALLPVERLRQDREELKAALSRIGILS